EKLRAPALKEPLAMESPKPILSGGAGTELKKLLAKIGITTTPDCACNQRAIEMDQKGVEWCAANVETIVGWLQEEATRRKLPFTKLGGRTLLRLAIRRASAGVTPSHRDPPAVT